MADTNLDMWFSEDQYDRYRDALRSVPCSVGEYSQPMFCYKGYSCEYGPDDSCGCVQYEERSKIRGEYKDSDTKYLVRYSRGLLWSDVMRAPESALMSLEEVSYYI